MRYLASSPGADKLCRLAMALPNVTFPQRQCDHDVRQRFGMARDDKNLIVRQRVGVVTQQFPTSED